MSRLDYSAEEIAEVANDHNLDIAEVERMMDAGYDPDTMVLVTDEAECDELERMEREGET